MKIQNKRVYLTHHNAVFTFFLSSGKYAIGKEVMLSEDALKKYEKIIEDYNNLQKWMEGQYYRRDKING